VDTSQLVFGSLLVVLLVALGGYYAWRQVRRLRELGAGPPDPDGEGNFYRGQAWRRLVCSVLMVLFAALLVGSFFLQQQLPEEVADGDKPRVLSADEEASIYLFSYCWIGLLILFLGILFLAAHDLWATRKFALRQLLKIHERHHELIEQQALRLRGQRNGPG
jgi:hypothetical protein